MKLPLLLLSLALAGPAIPALAEDASPSGAGVNQRGTRTCRGTRLTA